MAGVKEERRAHLVVPGRHEDCVPVAPASRAAWMDAWVSGTRRIVRELQESGKKAREGEWARAHLRKLMDSPPRSPEEEDRVEQVLE
jgi:hypothetical protein